MLDGNEADVRAEIADPLIAALGYKRGTGANIDREFRLTDPRQSLGHRKPNDPPLVGKPDYRLSVNGYGHWILDVKASNIGIGLKQIEQAISYARHPQVAGHYVAILNSSRFVLYRSTQSSLEPPMLDLEVTTPDALANKLLGLLSPAAIMRDCRPPIVDLGTPLADGLRSEARMKGGFIQYRNVEWHANASFPHSLTEEQDEICRRLSSYRTAITGGRIWRDAESRIRAKLTWSAPDPNMIKFAIDKRLFDTEYVGLQGTVSTDTGKPCPFDAIGCIAVQAGDQLFDFVRWRTRIAAIDCEMWFQGRASGALTGEHFVGEYQGEIIGEFPTVPQLSYSIRLAADFSVEIDRV